MRCHSTVLAVCTILLAASVMTSGCTSSGPAAPAALPTSPPPTFGDTAPAGPAPGNQGCGFTTCHGPDPACGFDAPQICTMEYRIGDKCRQFARCEAAGGSCTLVKDARFDTCRTCVEQCEAAARNDPVTAFSCEEKC